MGYATREACRDARRQILEIAARHYIKGSPDELEIKNSIICHKNNRDQKIDLKDFMTRLMPDALSPPLIVGRTAKQMPPSTTFSRFYAVHFAEVEVDTETGQIKIIDYLATQDSGTVLNPAVLENQVTGGAIAGSGFALVEGLVFENQTGKILNSSFTDYKVLRASDFPL
jgi:xanthine dehydrogenase molybdenum-binding subunit